MHYNIGYITNHHYFNWYVQTIKILWKETKLRLSETIHSIQFLIKALKWMVNSIFRGRHLKNTHNSACGYRWPSLAYLFTEEWDGMKKLRLDTASLGYNVAKYHSQYINTTIVSQVLLLNQFGYTKHS